MRPRSPLEYDISVSADKRRRARQRGMSGVTAAGERACDRPGCDRPGEYRAPRSPLAPGDYHWFCLDHVRDYNLGWNFFAGLAPDEVERQVEADRLWGRPTWAFSGRDHPRGDGAHAEGRAWARLGLADPLDLLGPRATLNPGRAGRTAARRVLPPAERRALDILGARDTMDKAEIRRLYKDLVKQLHPDTNGGSRADESRLQDVVWAWEQIRVSPHFPA